MDSKGVGLGESQTTAVQIFGWKMKQKFDEVAGGGRVNIKILNSIIRSRVQRNCETYLHWVPTRMQKLYKVNDILAKHSTTRFCDFVKKHRRYSHYSRS